MQWLVLIIVSSRIDYSSVVQAETPVAIIAPLNHVMNVVANIVASLGPWYNVAKTLYELHWLPVAWRVKSKLGVIMEPLWVVKVRTTSLTLWGSSFLVLIVTKTSRVDVQYWFILRRNRMMLNSSRRTDRNETDSCYCIVLMFYLSTIERTRLVAIHQTANFSTVEPLLLQRRV